MWTKLAHFVIKYRLVLLMVIALLTVIMATHALRVKPVYDFAKFVPADDPEMVYYEKFKEQFGEDANLVVLGLKDKKVFDNANFEKFKSLNDKISEIEGVREVISITRAKKITRNDNDERFDLTDLLDETNTLQHPMEQAGQFPFYEGRLFNSDNNALPVLVFLKESHLHSEVRNEIVDEIHQAGEGFSEETGIKVYYTGVPYIGALLVSKVKDELKLFLILSILITALVLFILFRSKEAVIFPLLIVSVVVIWVLGSIELLGFHITALTALIPPIIVVIGIPNSIYMLTRYHQEYDKHKNKIRALSNVVRRIGVVNLVNNLTTAIGFLVLVSTDVSMLVEFGLVAGINIIVTFIISLILIPAVFAYLPPPSGKRLKHLDFKLINRFFDFAANIVLKRRTALYVFTAVMCGVLVYGMTKVKAVSYMVDDLPAGDRIKTDLAFFEENFKGIMPMEIVLNTGKKKGAMQLPFLKKAAELEEFLAENKNLSTPISLVGFVKALTQAYYDNDPDFYRLPNKQERPFILNYLNNTTTKSDYLDSFTADDGKSMRITLQTADIGSVAIDSMINHMINPKMEEIFANSNVEAKVTGTTALYSQGNNYLVKNLKNSLLLAVALVALIVAVLFRNFRTVTMMIIPNLIPLLFTAALMGFFDIRLKPSTALIFGIAFGIAIDDAIHFLAKYRHELLLNNFSVKTAVTNAIKATGPAIFYTSMVLFAGFGIFAFSVFGGTVALGVLTASTMLFAMFINLILLPAVLMTFDSGKRDRQDHPPAEQIGNVYDLDEEKRKKGGKGIIGIPPELLEQTDAQKN